MNAMVKTEAVERRGQAVLWTVGLSYEVRSQDGTALFGANLEAALAYLDSRPRGRTVPAA